MHETLLFYHNAMRWLVLISLVYAIFRAYRGLRLRSTFSKADNSIRHWTATIVHIQMLLGIILYTQSPLVKKFWEDNQEDSLGFDLTFFGVIHISMMLLAVVLITIGSAKAKRKELDSEKSKTMLMWFTLGLLIILIAIPWPFSPLANRPCFR